MELYALLYLCLSSKPQNGTQVSGPSSQQAARPAHPTASSVPHLDSAPINGTSQNPMAQPQDLPRATDSSGPWASSLSGHFQGQPSKLRT
ncbi:hypothetical protein WJX84_004480 [Apatococcus fuscideae]|uniref:Uncharacterized protein n=1 Tax=Apatococcus fuscideae TaxID=2026836 RepID=A0AAW1TFG2_9CHLO